MSLEQDHYQILNVPRETGRIAIKRAYRRLALQWHPDLAAKENKVEAEKAFKKIVAAYFILGNKDSRKVYDHQNEAQDSVFKGESWNFVDPMKATFNEESFSFFYRQQLEDCDAFKLDWREVVGGTGPKIFAAILFVLIFRFGQEVLPGLSINFGLFRVSVPIVLVTMYIVLQSFRDFVWEYVGDDEIYDVFVLLFCWLVMISFALTAITKSIPPPVVDNTLPIVQDKQAPKTVYERIPVNLEIFTHPGDPFATK